MHIPLAKINDQIQLNKRRYHYYEEVEVIVIRRDGWNSLHRDGINRVYHVYIHNMRRRALVLRPITRVHKEILKIRKGFILQYAIIYKQNDTYR